MLIPLKKIPEVEEVSIYVWPFKKDFVAQNDLC